MPDCARPQGHLTRVQPCSEHAGPVLPEVQHRARASEDRSAAQAIPSLEGTWATCGQVRTDRKKAEFRKIKEKQGYERAIAAIKQHLGK